MITQRDGRRTPPADGLRVVEPDQLFVQVGGGEPPPERLCRGVVAVFECSEPIPDLLRSMKSLGETTLR